MIVAGFTLQNSFPSRSTTTSKRIVFPSQTDRHTPVHFHVATHLLRNGLCASFGEPSSASEFPPSLASSPECLPAAPPPPPTPFTHFPPAAASRRLQKSVSKCSPKASTNFPRKSRCVSVALAFSGRFIAMYLTQLLEKSWAAAAACRSQNSTQAGATPPSGDGDSAAIAAAI